MEEPASPKQIEEDPQYAEQRWFKDNGEFKSGRKIVKIHWYNGEPRCQNSIDKDIKVGDMIYRCYFKAGIYGIDTKHKRFYVVYTSEDNWDLIMDFNLSGKWLKMQHMTLKENAFNIDTHELVRLKNSV